MLEAGGPELVGIGIAGQALSEAWAITGLAVPVALKTVSAGRVQIPALPTSTAVIEAVPGACLAAVEAPLASPGFVIRVGHVCIAGSKALSPQDAEVEVVSAGVALGWVLTEAG